ncbi:DegT/DnrJ/EryC1/StrS aminotransferase [Dyadobacter luteus]|jgi:perosamine synthetase|uniref:DegT/DnrJ/EryC1/StrS aminotransferase n=1 Tax=Dyadobacter luteus TaxID=2259619 RepID=A0A3D8YDY8_9BACT|nr:aminotransferase class I/II-fold pyridoxal phosphate-dependent enzyme [Dyadobacter luteus]REA62702.1 DegT/DnrJ/EryC1/StrS aminotransferase [Dyadobacter luteus]
MSDSESSIPLCEPFLNGNEIKYSGQAIASNWLSGGEFLNLFEQQLADFTNSRFAIGVSSGTSALHIALIIAGVEEGDLVLVPDLTFVATANAVKFLKADPILIDVKSDSWVLDLDLLNEFLESETYLENGYCYHKKTRRRIRAVVPVHLLGNMCDMERLLSIGELYHLAVIEDAACSLGSVQNGRHSGTFGIMGTISFNSNKIITTGGGGAVLTDDEQIAKKVRFLITQAKSPGIEYHHSDLGYNYRLVNPLAAIGAAQMEQLERFIAVKKKVYNFYCNELDLQADQIQRIEAGTDSNHWHFVTLVRNSRELIRFLGNNRVESRPVWLPIHELPIFSKDIYISQNNNSKIISDRGVMLPCSTSITDGQLEKVGSLVREFNRR